MGYFISYSVWPYDEICLIILDIKSSFVRSFANESILFLCLSIGLMFSSRIRFLFSSWRSRLSHIVQIIICQFFSAFDLHPDRISLFQKHFCRREMKAQIRYRRTARCEKRLFLYLCWILKTSVENGLNFENTDVWWSWERARDRRLFVFGALWT